MNKLYVCMMAVCLLGCQAKEAVDLVVYNARIYTVDANFTQAEAFAVKDGRFVAVGSSAQIRQTYKGAQEWDAKGAPIYPGFHDAHCHFVGMGAGLQYVDLRGALSFQDVLDRVAAYAAKYPSGWIVGMGWDQNLWEEKVFPTNKELNEVYPNRPVVLKRIDGHAGIANEAAIKAVGLRVGDPSIPAGEALIQNGGFNGVFMERTYERFLAAVPPPSPAEEEINLMNAAAVCYQYGLTSVSDAGLSLTNILRIDSLQQAGRLALRVDAWMEPTEENFAHFTAPYRTERMTMGTVKLYADGALGSRGALMLKPYSDDSKTKGIYVTTDAQFTEDCRRAYEAGLQVATHCIGDAANQKCIDLYAPFLKGQNDLRWRIEHAQIVAPEDFARFKTYSIVPSVQPTHATSDMFWADERVGERLAGAYAYQKLLQEFGWLPLGTDYPIESVNPIYTFFAAVCRKNLDFLPEEGFQMQDALSREDALRGMTIWAAKASFDEGQKGSVEAGKWADFVMLDTDIMQASEREIPNIKVLATYISGKEMYKQ